LSSAFEERAEDRRFDLFPVGLRRLDQQPELQVVERECFGLFEQTAVEALEVLHEDLREAAGVHGLPQPFERGFSVFRVPAQLVEEFRKAATRDQIDVFSKHRKEAAH
jgi:hypothetical protein